MQHKTVTGLTHDRVDNLFVLLGTQCGNHQCLGFTTRKQGAAVRTGQHAQTDADGANRTGIATIDAGFTRQDLGTHNRRFEVEQNVFDLDRIGCCFFFGGSMLFEPGLDVGIDSAHCVSTRLLLANLISCNELIPCGRFDCSDKRFIFGRRLPFPLGLAGFGNQIMDGIDCGLHLVMTKYHTAQHQLFRKLAGLGFNHQNSRFSTRNDQIHIGRFQLRCGRIQHVLTINVANTSSADGAIEWNTGNRQSCRCANHGGDIGINFRINRQSMNDDLDIVVEPFREQRTQRAIDQTGCQGFFFGRLAFAFEKTTRNATGCIGFFNIINSKREKILTGLGLLGRNNGRQHNSVVNRDNYSTTGLTGNFARFKYHGVLAVLKRLGHFIEHY